jgi:hypothetical protein
MEEPGVVPNEKLLFDAGVRIGEGTALWLEDGADTIVGSDDVEPSEEVVVCESNDMFHGRE